MRRHIAPQVITPTKKQELHTGVNSLNARLQPLMNPFLRAEAAAAATSSKAPQRYKTEGKAAAAAPANYRRPPIKKGDKVVQVRSGGCVWWAS